MSRLNRVKAVREALPSLDLNAALQIVDAGLDVQVLQGLRSAEFRGFQSKLPGQEAAARRERIATAVFAVMHKDGAHATSHLEMVASDAIYAADVLIAALDRRAAEGQS